MTGAPEGSPKVVLCVFYGFFYGEAGNRTCDPWFTRHSAYPLHHGESKDIGLHLIHLTDFDSHCKFQHFKCIMNLQIYELTFIDVSFF